MVEYSKTGDSKTVINSDNINKNKGVHIEIHPGARYVKNFPTPGDYMTALTSSYIVDANRDGSIQVWDNREVSPREIFKNNEKIEIFWGFQGPRPGKIGMAIYKKLENGDEKKLNEGCLDNTSNIICVRPENSQDFPSGNYRTEFYYNGSKITELEFIILDK